MGLRDKLTNFSRPLNDIDPLFGGLIPRREVERQPIAPINKGMVINPKEDNVNISSVQPLMPKRNPFPLAPVNPLDSKNLVLDYTDQELNLKKKALDLEGQRMGMEQSRFDRQHSLAEQKLGQEGQIEKGKLDLEKDKGEIESRKQALDEWKVKNPEGEIKTTDDGRIVIIDKRTGKSVDTGLRGDHLNEREKLRIQYNNDINKMTAEHKNRLEQMVKQDELDEDNVRAGDRINPSQQRIAEDDAASELLRDPRYSWLEKEKIIVRGDNGLTINHPNRGFYGRPAKEAQDTIKAFEEELRTKASERMNRTISRGGKSTNNELVDMTDPDGNPLKVPKDKVEELKSKGAKLVGAK